MPREANENGATVLRSDERFEICLDVGEARHGRYIKDERRKTLLKIIVNSLCQLLPFPFVQRSRSSQQTTHNKKERWSPCATKKKRFDQDLVTSYSEKGGFIPAILVDPSSSHTKPKPKPNRCYHTIKIIHRRRVENCYDDDNDDDDQDDGSVGTNGNVAISIGIPTLCDVDGILSIHKMLLCRQQRHHRHHEQQQKRGKITSRCCCNFFQKY